MDDCFSNICAVNAIYKQAKGYSWADFDSPEIPINEEKILKMTRAMP